MSIEAIKQITATQRDVNRLTKDARRFMARVSKSESVDGCWAWLGAVDKDGYGKFPFFNKSFRAHRASYLLFVADPSDAYVCHSCDNPACVNPDHLFLGTQADNIADKVAKGRQSRGEKHGAIMRARDLRGDKNPMRLHPESVLRGEKNPTSKLTEAQVIEIRQRYAAGDTTQKKLGAEYGVNFSLIGYIVNRKVWQHIP